MAVYPIVLPFQWTQETQALLVPKKINTLQFKAVFKTLKNPKSNLNSYSIPWVLSQHKNPEFRNNPEIFNFHLNIITQQL